MQILIADDHSLFRDGLKHVLSALSADLIFQEAGNLDQLYTLIKQAETDAITYDLVIVDLKMPGMIDHDQVSEIRSRVAGVPVVVISASEEIADIRNAFDAGISGYIPKSARSQVMLAALQLVLAGGIYVPDLLLRQELKASPRFDPVIANNLKTLLTERQIDVLRLLAEGRPNKEIARQLNLAEGTVRVHVNAVLKALNARNRTEAALVARNAGLF